MKYRWKRIISVLLLAGLILADTHAWDADADIKQIRAANDVSKIAAGNRYKSAQEIKHERIFRRYMENGTKATHISYKSVGQLCAQDIGRRKNLMIIPVKGKANKDKAMSVFIRAGYLDCKTGTYTRTTRYSNGTYRSKTYSCLLVRQSGEKAGRLLRKLVGRYNNKVRRNLSDVELMARTQDFLTKYLTYDISAKDYSIAKLIQSKKTVCWGYSALYCYLLGTRGIDANVYLQNKINHQCNYVRLQGKTYWIDPTWADMPSLNKYLKESAAGASNTYMQFFLMDKKDRRKHDRKTPITLRYFNAGIR